MDDLRPVRRTGLFLWDEFLDPDDVEMCVEFPSHPFQTSDLLESVLFMELETL